MDTKKKKLTPEQLDEMEEYMEKLLKENQVLGEKCKEFLNSVRGHLFDEINVSELPKELLVYLLQRELLIVSKNLLPDKKLDHALIIIHEAIADTIKDNLYPQITERQSLH
tara:strand:+ start:770 stop:1102 length:333 start_codon:yes stop_codon:yes gene_type:complete